MTPPLLHPPLPRQPALHEGRRPRYRILLLLPLAGLILALASCSGGKAEPPPIPTIRTEPIGSGLKAVAYALLGGAVVLVLGRMIR